MIKLIIWIIIGLLALSFFGISLRAIAGSPTNQDNIQFLLMTLHQGWEFIVNWVEDFFSALGSIGAH